MSQEQSMTKTQLEAKVAELEAAVAAANKPRKLSLKVGAKGGVSLYGVNARFPVSLYAQQWERVLAHAPKILAFIVANESELSRK